MTLLRLVENRIGLVYTWPSIILQFIFIDTPTTLPVKNLISFSYGNGVPVKITVQLFQNCNAEADATDVEHFFTRYQKWQNAPFDTYQGIYFNMQVRKMRSSTDRGKIN